jgi:endopeptidase La
MSTQMMSDAVTKLNEYISKTKSQNVNQLLNRFKKCEIDPLSSFAITDKNLNTVVDDIESTYLALWKYCSNKKCKTMKELTKAVAEFASKPNNVLSTVASETESESEVASETESEVASETESESEVASDTESESEVASDTDTESETEEVLVTPTRILRSVVTTNVPTQSVPTTSVPTTSVAMPNVPTTSVAMPNVPTTSVATTSVTTPSGLMPITPGLNMTLNIPTNDLKEYMSKLFSWGYDDIDIDADDEYDEYDEEPVDDDDDEYVDGEMDVEMETDDSPLSRNKKASRSSKKPSKNATKSATKTAMNNVTKLLKIISKDSLNPQSSIRASMMKLNPTEQNEIISTAERISEVTDSKTPLMLRILTMENISDNNRALLLSSAKQLSQMNPSSGEYQKMSTWMRGAMAIPLGVYTESSISKLKTPTEKRQFLEETKENLDRISYGHEDAKRQILRILAQKMALNGSAENGSERGSERISERGSERISDRSSERTSDHGPKQTLVSISGGEVLGIQGPPGTGKTDTILRGFSPAIGKPMAFIALGGATDASFFEGHDYTYEGSTWGAIVGALMKAKCMNPIIFLDELDKISQTPKGEELLNMLIHMTDPMQNRLFNDKYFQGMEIDLSAVTFVFSFNSYDTIPHVLLDRMKVIRVKGYKESEKLKIATDFLIPQIYRDIGLSPDLVAITTDAVKHIITNYTVEGGVRKLKECIRDILMEFNLRQLSGDTAVSSTKESKSSKRKRTKAVKVLIEPDDLDNDYLRKKRRADHTLPHKQPIVGGVNGLWANELGFGGVLPIEFSWCIAPHMSMVLTGMQGDVMKESMTVALTYAQKLVPKKTLLRLQSNGKKNPRGIHIHCPDGATPKDGPSAGAGITIGLLSLMTNRPIRNDIAVTGEINLRGEVTAIGGLEEKVDGARRVGIKTVYCPKENQRDLDQIKEKFPEWFTNNKAFQVVAVEHVEELVELMLA